MQAILQDTDLPGPALELELTETALMEDMDISATILHDLRALGVKLAIDDFGTGYSSLAQLKNYPIDMLKVDRSFMQDIPSNEDDKTMTRAIISMGKSLGLTVVAEGVETQEQQNFLRENACDETQGFYFSKPVPERHRSLAAQSPRMMRRPRGRRIMRVPPYRPCLPFNR